MEAILPLNPLQIDLITDHFSIRLIQQKNADPTSTGNTGTIIAQGNYLVLTDDEGQSDPNWLHPLELSLKNCPSSLVAGHTVNALLYNICNLNL